MYLFKIDKRIHFFPDYKSEISIEKNPNDKLLMHYKPQ